MSAFVATDPRPSENEEDITNVAFFPDVSPASFRNAVKISGSIDSDEVKHVLISAMQSVNDDLQLWRQTQELAGHQELKDVPADEILDTSVKLFQYERAVYSYAKAEIIERRPDYDNTQKGVDRSEALNSAVDQYRRSAKVAIRKIMERPSSTIELI